MRVVSAVSGELLLSLPEGNNDRDAEHGVAKLLGISSAFVLATVTECSVVVLSGKVHCNSCGGKAFCSCNDEEACECEVLEELERMGYLCDECNARESAEYAADEWRKREKERF